MKRFVTWAILICFIPIAGWPSSIVKVKGDRALIAMDGEQPIAVGQTFYTVDSSGKKRSLIKILQVKENRAVAQIIKGKSAEGHMLLEAQQAQAKVAKSEAPSGRLTAKELSGYGLLVSYLMNTMTADYAVGGTNYTTGMKGFGVSFLGYRDFELSERADVRVSLGYERFQVSEERTDLSCDLGTSNTCNANINYLSSYALYKYAISNGATRKVWLGAGGGFLLALSKSSTVLKSSQITANSVITVSSGVEFAMKQGQYLPLILEYSMFPSSPGVEANYIAIRIGWGWR